MIAVALSLTGAKRTWRASVILEKSWQMNPDLMLGSVGCNYLRLPRTERIGHQWCIAVAVVSSEFAWSVAH